MGQAASGGRDEDHGAAASGGYRLTACGDIELGKQRLKVDSLHGTYGPEGIPDTNRTCTMGFYDPLRHFPRVQFQQSSSIQSSTIFSAVWGTWKTLRLALMEGGQVNREERR